MPAPKQQRYQPLEPSEPEETVISPERGKISNVGYAQTPCTPELLSFPEDEEEHEHHKQHTSQQNEWSFLEEEGEEEHGEGEGGARRRKQMKV